MKQLFSEKAGFVFDFIVLVNYPILSRTYFLNQSGILSCLISISWASVISAIHVDCSSELSKM